MSAQDAFKVFRRMWPAAVVLGLVSAAVMWLITPVAINTERKVGSFNAVATLLVTAKPQPTPSPTPTPRRRPTPTATATPRGTATPTPTPTPSPTPGADLALAVHRVALLVTTGEVPSRAAESLGYRGDPADLLAELGVTAHASTGTVTISMKSKESRLAVERVNAFALATVNYFSNEIRMEGVEVTLLEEATALPNEPTGSFVTPPTRLARTLVAGGLGLLFGLGLVLLVEAIGPRLRSRSAVAMSLGIPVFAEVPTRRRGFGDGARRLVVLEIPRGAEADGYRALKSATIHATRRPAGKGEEATTPGQVVLVTAADIEAGAAEVAANLAMTIAIDELKVLALDADLRRPGLHEWFDVGDSDGAVGFLGAAPGADLDDYTRPTLMPNVSVLPAGSGGGDHPAYWVSQFGVLLDQARTKADVVLVAASPILAASEVFDLIPLADTVLVPVRAGRLLPADARRLAELMARFPHPEAGAVLLGSDQPTKRSRARR